MGLKGNNIGCLSVTKNVTNGGCRCGNDCKLERYNVWPLRQDNKGCFGETAEKQRFFSFILESREIFRKDNGFISEYNILF